MQFSAKLVICELTEAKLAVGYNECMRDMLHVQFLSRLTPSLLSGFMFSCHFVQYMC